MGNIIPYTRAFDDGQRHFEACSSDVDDTRAGTPPLLTTTPHQWEDVSAVDRFNMHRSPARRGTGLEFVTRPVTITAATVHLLSAAPYGRIPIAAVNFDAQSPP
ncbi:hypothetical protein TNCV_298691 [Trichonephila clavipes]|nr:hypothetical protein TNCV_298691 [Trichonephila clavipes]